MYVSEQVFVHSNICKKKIGGNIVNHFQCKPLVPHKNPAIFSYIVDSALVLESVINWTASKLN